jgi:hypothetical protein
MYDYLASNAAAKTMTVFVAAFEDADLLCIVVSDTSIGTIIPPQTPLTIQY